MVKRKLELGGKFVRGAIKRLKRKKKWPPRDRLGELFGSNLLTKEAERLTGQTVGKETRNLGKTLKKGTGKIAKVRAIRGTLESKMKKVIGKIHNKARLLGVIEGLKKYPKTGVLKAPKIAGIKNLKKYRKTISNLNKYEEKIHRVNKALIDKVRKKPTLHKEGGLIKKPKSIRIAKRGWGKAIR